MTKNDFIDILKAEYEKDKRKNLIQMNKIKWSFYD